MADIATREAYGKALVELGEKHPDVVVLDADLSKSTKTIDFARRFPERFFNAGIAEQNMIGMAAGLAASGKVPFASSFAVFASGRAFEIIRNSVCYPGLNVKIGASHAGVTVGEDGGSHQSVEDIALMRVLPGMKVIVPADDVATRAAVMAAYDEPGPVYLRLGRTAVPRIYEEGAAFALGRANILREGSDVLLVACGIMVSEALKAAAELEKMGIKAAVMDMHTIKPLDEETLIDWAEKTGAVVTAEEHSIIGGLGSAVAECLAEFRPVPVVRVGIRDQFGQSGQPRELMAHYHLLAEDIVEAAVKSTRMKRY